LKVSAKRAPFKDGRCVAVDHVPAPVERTRG